ncbi:hypothetical protein MKX03_021336 [Papaver bracteatum]|nr:hypothetical protein MKX03_021336 [Papaver bracteatum]
MLKDPRLNNLNVESTGFCRTPLHVAVISGDIRFAKSILSQSLDLALKQYSRGWTPLHLASAKASLQMVKLLLNSDPSACTIKDEDERTPLHLAVMNNRISIMEVLINKRPDAIHLRNDENGETILHFCVKSNSSIETLELLVDKLALARTSDPSIIINCNNGKSVLQLAAETGKIEMIQCFLESSNAKIEKDDANEALNTLTPSDKNDLENRFLEYLVSDQAQHLGRNKKRKVLSKNGAHEGLKERVNTLMVVATLIAGIAFQAAMDPPGGAWQDDSKVDSGTNPVTFAYYLDHMFRSDNLDRYIEKLLPDYSGFEDGSNKSTRSKNIKQFVRELLIQTIGGDNLNKHSSDMAVKGLMLDDVDFSDIVSSYTNSAKSSTGVFFPYLIRYAGYPILAYKYPTNYLIYMVTNAVAFFVSLTIIFLVICGFMNESSVTQVRFLVVLMGISIGCIASGYLSILTAMQPEYCFQTELMFFALYVFFGVCCFMGVLFFLSHLWMMILDLDRGDVGVIDHLKEFFNASAAGKLILFIICYGAFCTTGYIYYGEWSSWLFVFPYRIKTKK